MGCGCDTSTRELKLDQLGHWLDETWQSRFPNVAGTTLMDSMSCVSRKALDSFDRDKVLAESHTFLGFEPLADSPVPFISRRTGKGEITYQSGLFRYCFQSQAGEAIEVLVGAAYYADDVSYDMICLARVPENFELVWHAFAEECNRLDGGMKPTSEVRIIGGRTSSFEPTTDWEDVILPDDLKQDIFDDVQSFFVKGIDVYKRLRLKPFRKLLLAGVPGTGKTMLCSALAKWAIDREYVVIYVSSGDQHGNKFWKIHEALRIAANSELPALIILEELDAYLNDDEKALVLNVLDGAEASINDKGSLLIATTNYPEMIDDRVLKRPGRLDRVFIVPEARTTDSAELMLRQYLGEMWQDDHRRLGQSLIGYPGAFIREVAILALTQVAYDDLTELPVEVLERSFKRLRDQIEARDDFLTRKTDFGFSKIS